MHTLYFGLRLLAELVPLFLLISTLVYLAVEALTPERIQRWLGGGPGSSKVPLATALGAVTPFCSCSTVPVVNGMRLAGIPTAPLVAFLIASPLISPVAIALLWSAIGAEYAVLYTAAALVAAAGGGVLVERWHQGRVQRLEPVASSVGAAATACGCGSAQPGLREVSGPLMRGRAEVPSGGSTALALPLEVTVRVAPGFGLRLGRAFTRSLSDLRKLALPLFVAVAVGAAIYGYVPDAVLVKVAGPDTAWAVPAAALLGTPVYASILVLLPLASTLLAKGVGIGAVTAFLMGASGFSLPEGILLSRILPGSILWRIVVVFTASVIGIGYLLQWIAG